MAGLPDIIELGKRLRDETIPMKARNRALFTLRAVTDKELLETAVNEIYTAFSDSSALLKHECAYCLGQMGADKAVNLLVAILHDVKQEVIVRHEAGEALGERNVV